MPETGNDFFDIAAQVGREVLERKREARKAKPVPFGQEQVDAETLRLRLASDRDLRLKMLQEQGGRERILKLYRQKGGR